MFACVVFEKSTAFQFSFLEFEEIDLFTEKNNLVFASVVFEKSAAFQFSFPEFEK